MSGPAPAKRLVAAKFTIDSCPNVVFDGSWRTEYWNGWACPGFTFDQAMTVCETMTRLKTISRFEHDRESDQFLIWDFDDDEPLAFERDEDGLYWIGAWYWIWETAEEQ
jgi:hypothetical protein